MGIAGPTVVLSFPMLEPAAFPSGQMLASVTGRGKRRTHIGDIAISVERAIEQAEQGRGGHTGDVRWAASDGLPRLVAHGALHLCGLEHAGARGEVEMAPLATPPLSGVAPPAAATPRPHATPARTS